MKSILEKKPTQEAQKPKWKRRTPEAGKETCTLPFEIALYYSQGTNIWRDLAINTILCTLVRWMQTRIAGK